MQNKCNCGCQQGFVPVSGNWGGSSAGNFNNSCSCEQGYARQNRRSNRNQDNGRNSGDCEAVYTRERERDCQCERCDDAREVERCDKNTHVRDMNEREQAYTRPRSNCGCDKDDVAYTRTRNNGSCAKEGNNRTRSNDGDQDDAATYDRSRKNRTVGMINVEMQEIDRIFESESALRAGTLFPELHKPLNGYCPCDSKCGTCAQQTAFAAWELRLYLNTHPHDKEALALFRKLCKEAEGINYATTFLAEDCCAKGWDWVNNPWPWEYDCNCGK